MDIRPCLATDRDACLAVFDSNTPDSFDPSERPEFALFLESLKGTYLVLEHAGQIVACGGHYLTADPTRARLAWGMVHREHHRQGLGRFLLLYRLRELGKLPGVQVVLVNTSQHAVGFFAKLGFKTLEVKPNGFAPGLDEVRMAMKIQVCP
jgi:GNAT superfamily N-acetyltransferase